MTDALIRSMSRRPSRALARPGIVLAFAIALSYLVGLWLTWIHARSGGTPLASGALLSHALRVGTLALPALFTATWLGVLLARRVVGPDERAGTSATRSVTLTIAVAATAAVAFALLEPLHGVLFGGGHHHGGGPLLMQMARDGFLAFLPSLAVAGALAALLASRAPWSAPDVRGWATSQRRMRRLALPGLVAVLVLAPTALAAQLGSERAVAASGPGTPCPATAPVKHFAVQSIDVKIPLNRFGDNDPLGKMYVLSGRVAAVRAEEASQKVSIGLRDDAIQPLVIRANEGDCVEIDYANNASGGAYGMHIDGLSYEAGSSGDAIGANPSSQVDRGQSTFYRYYVPDEATAEGAHYLRPGPGNRDAVSHGLFGALVVEPHGSTYLDANDGSPLVSGWEAMIQPDGNKAFREYALLFHEIGNEKYKIKDKTGHDVEFVDPFTTSYRPDSKAINYRSEPFMNRLNANPEQESQGYGSYAFGDPATPMPRGYLGDPTKIRLVHAGSEMFHVFHLHGGGIRWRFNPKADPTFDYADTKLDKAPKTELSPSARLDSQSMGPGETFNLEIEGGAGGVQKASGEFLFHCHIAEHYISGMWSFWRVFGTHTPELATLPDRAPLPDPVTSAQLIGKTMPDGTTLTAQNIDQWIRPQLPPQGVRQDDQDASVWNWAVDKSDPAKPVYLGEPEDTTPWPDSPEGVLGHPNSYPVDRFLPGGNRPEILFNPTNGRPSFPLLRTHVGDRPPFSPNGHSGAPYLGETADQAPSGNGPDPWANRPDGICPATAPVRHYNIVAINLPIQVTAKGGIDQNGKIYVLAQDKADVLSGKKPAEPLAIRANIGDCVAVTLSSELPNASQFGGFSKVNIHIHHVQFDTQASDGVISGMSFEQSIRPYKEAPEESQLTAAAAPGDTVLHLANASTLREGVFVAVGQGLTSIEVRQVTAIAGNDVTLNKPLSNAHATGEYAGTEFEQYRWYPDVELDNIFWHDHVDGIHNWGHGLVGQLIVEPRDAKYRDPVTGQPTDGAGTYTDIITQNALIPGLVDKSFREFALWTLDENPITDSTLNLRAEPWNDRLGGPGSKDPSLLFSSYAHGDPYTPLPRAYAGDPFVIRTINVGPSVDTLHVDGHSLFLENRYTNPATGDTESTPLNTIHYGISERFTLALDGGAGGPSHTAGDYMYYNGIGRRFRQGAWGLIRVLPHQVPNLQVLPDTTVPASGAPLPSQTGGRPPAAGGPGDPCPAGAAPVNVDVSAVDVAGQPAGHAMAFVPSDQADDVISGAKDPEPLVIHVAAGQCLNVHFTNRLKSGRASFHLDELQKAIESSGVDAGYSPEQTVGPGESRDYRFYPATAKIATALISDFGYAGLGGGVRTDTGPDGLYGAVEVAPVDATFTDPVSGAPARFGSQVDVHLADGSGYRDLTVALSDQDPQIGASFMPYPTAVDGPALVNYKSAPLGDDTGNAFATTPATPMLRVRQGDAVRVHALVAPGSEQMHVFNLGGLSWPLDPFIDHGNVLTSLGIGPTETLDAHITPGAAAGDYFYGDMRRPFTDAGMWGILRVLPSADCGQIKPLPGAACAPPPAASPPPDAQSSAQQSSALSTAGSVDPAPKSRIRGLVLPKTVNLTTLPATGVAVRLVGPTETRALRLQVIRKVGSKTRVVTQATLRVPAPGKRAKGKKSIALSARWKPLRRVAAHIAAGTYTVRVQAGPKVGKLWPDTLQGRTKLVRKKATHSTAKAHTRAKTRRR